MPARDEKPWPLLRARYALLDELPRPLFDAVVTCSRGEVTARAGAVLALRRALLSGGLPARADLAWPEGMLADGLLEALARTGVAGLCEANPDTADAIILVVLRAVDRRADDPDLEELARDLALEAAGHRPRQRLRDGRLGGGTCDGSVSGDLVLGQAVFERAREQALLVVTQVLAERLHDALESTWGERVRAWRALREVLDALGGPRCAGRLPAWLAASLPLDAAIELRKWISAAPPLTNLLRALGRADVDDVADDAVLERTGRLLEREVAVPCPLLRRGEVDIVGVERGGDWTRMLPAEALLLRRPALKALWHARRAEHALATYDARRIDAVPETRSIAFDPGLVQEHERAKRGPIVIVLDTSGSMDGAREDVAKAIVAQTLVVASLDARPVYLYNFSGAGEVVEHELDLRGDGLANALAFLTVSFHGGTVVEEPLRRALERVHEASWRLADILLVTDGFLGPIDWTEASSRMLHAARAELGLRLQTALVAPRDSTLHDPVVSLSDRVHDVPRWMDAYRIAN